MKVLIRQANIIDPSSPFNGQIKDIFIENGIITSIANSIDAKADEIINAEGQCASIGWMDIFAHFCDPGYEFRESLESGAKAAAAGGFTDIMVMPNTNPSVQNKSQVEYIIRKSTTLPVNIHPIGTVTKNAEGKELAEIYDMQRSGALAFSDGINGIQSAAVLIKALQYVLPFNGVVIQLPGDKAVNSLGLVNGGIMSTKLGLPGRPAIAEELMISRDIELVRYTNSKIHFTGVSTQKGMELISSAKAAGLNITCSVTPYHLTFCDEDLTTYDTNFKVDPPLRKREDMMSLRQAVRDNKVDCIASHHIPWDWDNKTCEFEFAKYGMIGLESLFGSLGALKLEKVIEMLAIAPRKIFGLPLPQLKEGSAAKLTLFDPEAEYVFNEPMIASRSKNSPFIGRTLKGRVAGIVNGNHSVINSI